MQNRWSVGLQFSYDSTLTVIAFREVFQESDKHKEMPFDLLVKFRMWNPRAEIRRSVTNKVVTPFSFVEGHQALPSLAFEIFIN